MSRVVHFEIPAKNPEKAVGFYTQVFDWEITRWDEAPYWLVSTGPETEAGINGAIVPKASDDLTEEPKKIVDAAHSINSVITIDVADINNTIAKIREQGGKIVMDVSPITGVGKMAYFTDLDGNILGVMQSE